MIQGNLVCQILDSDYCISESGNIYSRYQTSEYYIPRIKHRIGTDGYPAVNLWINGANKTFAIHRLLAISFIPNPENKPQVNHKNGNKLDYSLNNLEWCTASENMQHAVDTGLCKPPHVACKIIDISTGKLYPSIKKAAADHNISYSNCKKYLLGLVRNKTSLRYA